MDALKISKEILEAEIRKIKEVTYFRHWSYHPNEPPPRAPICPKCNGRMKIEDVIGETTDGSGNNQFVPALHISCTSCNAEPQIVYGLEMQGLTSALGWVSEELKLPVKRSK